MPRSGARSARHLVEVAARLRDAVGRIDLSRAAAYVYHPLDYAWEVHEAYLRRYGGRRGVVLAVGMNPGPFGMAQTGVPFGEVAAVRDYLGLSGEVRTPARFHPKRPVLGFACPRSEVSGRRLWGLARACHPDADAFFDRWFVANYCPVLLLDEAGRNRTPDRLPRERARPLFDACDTALRETIEQLAPRALVGVGAFAARRLRAVAPQGAEVVQVLHPSPASPQANRGWAGQARRQLAAAGLCPG